MFKEKFSARQWTPAPVFGHGDVHGSNVTERSDFSPVFWLANGAGGGRPNDGWAWSYPLLIAAFLLGAFLIRS